MEPKVIFPSWISEEAKGLIIGLLNDNSESTKSSEKVEKPAQEWLLDIDWEKIRNTDHNPASLSPNFEISSFQSVELETLKEPLVPSEFYTVGNTENRRVFEEFEKSVVEIVTMTGCSKAKSGYMGPVFRMVKVKQKGSKEEIQKEVKEEIVESKMKKLIREKLKSVR